MAAVLAALLAASGERIASVSLQAPPADQARLSRYVEIKAGDELDPDAVRHVVELLLATGEFADVVVEKRASATGVELAIRPLPAPLMEAVRVEGDRVVDAEEARRHSRLQQKEPLWPRRLARAAADVVSALQAKGYLQAAVEARAGRERGRTVAVFAVRAGERARVGAVHLLGAESPVTGVLRRLARPRPGEPFEQKQADEAAEAMRKELVRRGHWRAAVGIRREGSGGRVDLAFEVAAGPITGVRFDGAPVQNPLRESILELLREGRIGSEVVDEAAERLEEDFRRRGHRQPTVTTARSGGGAREEVIFTVQPGPLSRVAFVRVEGTAGPLPALSTRPGEPLQDALLAEDEKRLLRLLEESGHHQARVDTQAAEDGGAVGVVFSVQPGPRTTVAAATVEAPLADPPPTILRLQVGQPFRARDVALERESLLARYRDAGYAQAQVAPEVVLSADKTQASVVLRVRPGPQVLVDHVVISGLLRTREEVVRRELMVAEGQPLGDSRLLESQQRLGSLGLFARVTLSEMDPESLPRRTVVVQATEAPLTTVGYGVGYAERDQLRGSVEVTRRNLFGMDRSVSAFARASFRGSRFLATFREPYLFGRRQELFVTAFREEEDRPAFDFVRAGLLVQTARAPTRGTSLIFRYAYQLTDTYNVVSPDEVDRQFTDSTLSGPSASAVHDSRDDPFDPRRGHFLSADVQLSHSLLGGDSFWKGFFQATHYQRLSSRAVVAMGARLGMARTFGEVKGPLLPRPDRFYAGGDYSLRGFPVDGVLPTGGNGLLLGGAELRHDLGRYFAAAIFIDAGNVFPLVGDLELADLRYAAGVGLRYRSAVGPLRVDLGHKLDRRLGESAYRVHFTLGHAF